MPDTEATVQFHFTARFDVEMAGRELHGHLNVKIKSDAHARTSIGNLAQIRAFVCEIQLIDFQGPDRFAGRDRVRGDGEARIRSEQLLSHGERMRLRGQRINFEPSDVMITQITDVTGENGIRREVQSLIERFAQDLRKLIRCPGPFSDQ